MAAKSGRLIGRCPNCGGSILAWHKIDDRMIGKTLGRCEDCGMVIGGDFLPSSKETPADRLIRLETRVARLEEELRRRR